MSEQEIKEQIERDADDYVMGRATIEDSDFVSYVGGATNQDKIATNRTVEQAINIIHRNSHQLRFIVIEGLIKELEKLKK